MPAAHQNMKKPVSLRNQFDLRKFQIPMSIIKNKKAYEQFLINSKNGKQMEHLSLLQRLKLVQVKLVHPVISFRFGLR